MNCIHCNKTIITAHDYRKVTGWEKHRHQGGTNALKLRETTDEWACANCINKLNRGLNVEQQSLI